MKVVLTGGAGYIGTELVSKLAQDDQVSEIVIYDNLDRGNYNLFLDFPFKNGEKVKFVKGDILDTYTLNKVVDGAETVYHLAAKVITPYANMDPHFFEQVNNWGTAELAYAVEKSSVKNLVYTSSISVYGMHTEEVTETTIPDPGTFYGNSKLRGEEHLERLMDSRKILILRCGNVYGYSHSMRFDAVINRFVFDANYHNRISIQGDGHQFRPFIHIDTISQVLADIYKHDIPSGKYNLFEQNLSILDVVDALKVIKPDLEFLFVNQHLKLRTIKVNKDFLLKKYLKFDEFPSLVSRLERFMQHFSF